MKRIAAKYISDIPAAAREVDVKPARVRNGAIWLRRVKCLLGRRLVGTRDYQKNGRLAIERPIKNGLQHGRSYSFHDGGRVECREPYRNGLPDGVCHQWDDRGRWLGSYRLRAGSGYDVWRDRMGGRKPFVTEIHAMRGGLPHGYEWWFWRQGAGGLWSERHWRRGKRHGIERTWTMRGSLEKGYPKFWVAGKPVSRREYLRRAAKDRTLPRLRDNDADGGHVFRARVSAVLAKVG